MTATNEPSPPVRPPADPAAEQPPPPVRFDTKIAVVLRDDLAGWQRMNVTAFLASAIAGQAPELIGEPYADADSEADGTFYLPMFRQPVVVLEAGKEAITAAHTRAVGRGIPVAVFIGDMFSTGNDHDNRAAVRTVARSALDLVGIGLHGPRNAIDKVVKGARMHP